MIIAYSPQGGEQRAWNLSETRVMATEAEAVERITDWTWRQTLSRLEQGSTTALRAVAFILEKRDQPTLRYAQFNPAADELDYWLDAQERADYRRQILESTKVSEEERETLLRDLDELDAEMVKRGLEPDPAAEGTSEDVPKASAPEASPTVVSPLSPGSDTSAASAPGSSTA